MGQIIKNCYKHHESMVLAEEPDGKSQSFSPNHQMLVSFTKSFHMQS